MLVEVWTKRNDEVRNGYEVWFSPTVYRDDVKQHKRFSRVSSPTSSPSHQAGI